MPTKPTRWLAGDRPGKRLGTTILRSLLIAIMLRLSVSPTAYAVDWESCASDLDRLRRAASYAFDAAEEASSAQDDVESCDDFDDFEDCDSERDEFESAVSNAESEIDTVASRFRSVALSCGITVDPSVHPSVTSKCRPFQRLKGQVPLEKLLESCAKFMPAAECSRCLSTGAP